jgi:putative membrane protein
MTGHTHPEMNPGGPAWVLALLLAGGIVAYLVAVHRLRARNIRWPMRRTAAWMGGNAVAAAAVTGPLPAAADSDFVLHMVAHLLLGMLAPLLLVPGTPVTLVLRVLPVAQARWVSATLRSLPARAVGHPLGAAALNVGGLWLFYTTDLFSLSHESPLLHALVQVHFLVAGYLLVAALVGSDPQPHRPGFRTRGTVLVLAVAGHDILAKYLYAHPPTGIPPDQGAAGGVLMYYGGGALEILLMVLFCRNWYVAAGRSRWSPHATRIAGNTA